MPGPSAEQDIAMDPRAFEGLALGSPNPFKPHEQIQLPGIIVACPVVTPPPQLMGFPPTVPCGTLEQAVFLYAINQNNAGDTHLVCAACGYATVWRVAIQRFEPFPGMSYPGGYLPPRRPGSPPAKIGGAAAALTAATEAAAPRGFKRFGQRAQVAIEAAAKAVAPKVRREFLSVGEAAERTGLDPAVLFRAIKARKLRSLKREGKPRIAVSDLTEWARTRVAPVAADTSRIAPGDVDELAKIPDARSKKNTTTREVAGALSPEPPKATGFTCPAHAKGCPSGSHPWVP